MKERIKSDRPPKPVLKQLEEIDSEVEHLNRCSKKLKNVCDDNVVLSTNSPEPKQKDQTFVATKKNQKSEWSKPNKYLYLLRSHQKN